MLTYIGTTYDDGYSTRQRFNYVALNCHKVEDPELDHTEFIETQLKSLNDFHQQLLKGALTDSVTAHKGLHHLHLLPLNYRSEIEVLVSC